MLFNRISNWFKNSVRVVLTVFVCGSLFLATANPAQAATSKPTDGEASLSRIQAEADKVANSNPRGMEEMTKKAEGGLNAVQGSADKDKMISPEDTDATTVKEKAAGFLENLTN